MPDPPDHGEIADFGAGGQRGGNHVMRTLCLALVEQPITHMPR